MDKSVVRKVATLARLRLDDGEVEGLQRDMGRIVDHIRSLEGAPDEASAAPWPSRADRPSPSLRPDAALPSLSPEAVLRAAPKAKDDLVVVPFPGEAT